MADRENYRFRGIHSGPDNWEGPRRSEEQKYSCSCHKPSSWPANLLPGATSALVFEETVTILIYSIAFVSWPIIK
jgi:hypothetical protein